MEAIKATGRKVSNGTKLEITLHFSDGSSKVVLKAGSTDRRYVNFWSWCSAPATADCQKRNGRWGTEYRATAHQTGKWTRLDDSSHMTFNGKDMEGGTERAWFAEGDSIERAARRGMFHKFKGKQPVEVTRWNVEAQKEEPAGTIKMGDPVELRATVCTKSLKIEMVD